MVRSVSGFSFILGSCLFALRKITHLLINVPIEVNGNRFRSATSKLTVYSFFLFLKLVLNVTVIALHLVWSIIYLAQECCMSATGL